MSADQPPIPQGEPPPSPVETPAPPPLTVNPPAEPSYGVNLLVGFVSFFGLLLAFVGSTVAIASRSPVAAVVIIAFLCILSVFALRRLRRPGFVVGGLIGLGLVALAGGICAALVASA